VTTPEITGDHVMINQVETSQFPKVILFATVLKDGTPVPGLTDKDFRVREDEVDQEPLTVVPKLTPLSVVLTLDTSGSMKKRLADAQSAAKGFVKTLQPQDKVQLIRFSRDVKTIYPMGNDRSAAEAAVDNTSARGDTALWDAVFASLESLRDVQGRKAIVLLSDGVDDDGTGKPLSKHTTSEVLELARQVNVPIFAIGVGTELDEVGLKKLTTETGARYLNAIEPGELARLYDSIGKQLAGQYTIYYTSNLPADAAEHRVQLKFGSVTSTKAYVPPAGGGAQPVKTKTKLVEAETVKAEVGPDTAISDKAPSSDLGAPVALNLGEVVKGRLADSGKSGKYHYWLVDLPAGKYKFVLDVRRADDKDSNIGGDLYLVSPEGKETNKIGSMNEIDHRHRGVYRIEASEPVQGILRYGNEHTVCDYYLGVFPESDRLGGLFFIKPPAITPLKRGTPVTTPVLDGQKTWMRDAYYSINLPAGDYKVSVEFRRADQKESNVGGSVDVLGEDGNDIQSAVVRVNEIAPAAKQAAKLSSADEAHLVFKVRGDYTKETAVFTVEDWME
jgi:VWFA-related protein